MASIPVPSPGITPGIGTGRKAGVRAVMLARRRRLAAGLGAMAAAALCRFAANLPPGARRQGGVVAGYVVAGYWPLAGEIDVRPLLGRLAAAGARIALPVAAARRAPLVFRLWRPGRRLDRGPHGTRHPLPAAPRVVPGVVLVPLVAFDRSGTRLGFGAGYYDRTLARLRRIAGPPGRTRSSPWVIGVAFARQQVYALPRDRHDQPLDAVLTERGLLWTRRGAVRRAGGAISRHEM